MKVLLGVQGRSNSSRFPKKIYQKIGDKELLLWAYEAINEATKILKKELNIEAIARVLGPKNDQELKDFCKSKKLASNFPDCEEGDLVERYRIASKEFTHIVRVTSDCWRLDPWLIASMVDVLIKGEFDYVSNTIFRTFEEGKDIQCASQEGLAWFDVNQTSEREHPFVEFDLNKKVRDHFEKDQFKYTNFLNPRFSFLVHGSSINTAEELELANQVYEAEKQQRMAGTSEKLPGPRVAGNKFQTL